MKKLLLIVGICLFVSGCFGEDTTANTESGECTIDCSSSEVIGTSSEPEGSTDPVSSDDRWSIAIQSSDDTPRTPTTWDLVWSDEFEGSTVDTSIWGYDEGDHGFGNAELQYYTRDNASVADGKLIITAKREKKTWRDYTSSKLVTSGKYSVKYGRIEARIKMPKGLGMWPAFWMLGNNGAVWPKNGEIDIMEAKGRHPSISSGAVHMGKVYNYKDTQWSQVDRGVDLSEDFHLYAVEWDEKEIRWYNDTLNYYTTQKGVSQLSTSEGGGDCDDLIWCPFGETADWEFYIILNVAIGGTFDDYTEPPASWSSTTMEVDWVRVYKAQ